VRGFKLISYGVCLLGLSLNSLAQLPPLAEAAEYYFSKHDYAESLNLWKQVYKLGPTSEEAMSKVAHLELMLEGHEPAEKTVVDFIRRYQNHLADSDLRRLRNLYYEIQTRFIKEEAQSFYFQALAKIKLKDFSKGLTLLNQSQKAEKGNLLIFQAEAQVEKRLGLFSKYYDTLKSGAAFNVFSTSWRDELLEAQYHFKDYSDILEWYESQIKSQLTSRQRLIIGLTLLEKGESRKAVFLLEKLQDNFQDKGMSSVVWYVLGKVYRENTALSKSFVTYSTKFLNATKSLEIVSEGIWDPYRLAEKRAEVLKWQ
jgi:hypothetical protein